MAMTDKQKGIMDELMDALSGATGGIMTGSFINEIKGLMDGLSGSGVTQSSSFDVDGKTEDYTFTGDAPLSLEAIQRMRDNQKITADHKSEAVPLPRIAPAAYTDVGLTPEQRQFIDSLPEPLRLRVEEHRENDPPETFIKMINQLMEGVIGAGAVWEGANAGFQQYNRNTTLPNLGFAGYPQG